MLVPAATVLATDHRPEEALVPDGILWRTDSDGGRTYQTTIMDRPGAMAHLSLEDTVKVGIWKETIAEALGQVEPVDDAGTYANQWSDAYGHYSTHGVYVVTRDRGLERFPLAIIEGGTISVGGEAVFGVGVLAYVANYLFPTSRPIHDEVHAQLDPIGVLGIPVGWLVATIVLDIVYPHPADQPYLGHTYDEDTLSYIWATRHETPAGTVWNGVYRTTWATNTGGSTATADRYDETGLVTRVDGRTQRLVGVYVLQENTRTLTSSSSSAEMLVTAGTVLAGGERIPLVTMRAHDDRQGGNLHWYPSQQNAGFSVGVRDMEGTYVPLVGTQTDVRNKALGGQRVETTRTTSLGVFVQGAYTPVLGVRYWSDTYAPEGQVLNHQGVGHPDTGDLRVDLGAFVLGEFEPAASLSYENDVKGAWWSHQALISAGPWVAGTFTPVIGISYDSTTTLDQAALGTLPAMNTEPFLISAGTFASGKYVPLVGIEHRPSSFHDGRTEQQTVSVGVFPTRYRSFLPLLMVTWDGDHDPVFWVLEAPLLLGGHTDWQASVGTGATGSYTPLVGAEHRSTSSQGAPSGWQTGELAVGPYTPEGQRPLVVVTVESEHTLPQVLLRLVFGTDTSPDQEVHVGLHVDGEYVPLLTSP